LTQESPVLVQKLIVAQLLKEFQAFYETRNFTIVFIASDPDPDEFSPQPRILFLEDFLQLSFAKLCMHFSSILLHSWI
jgi:hypothetical protein